MELLRDRSEDFAEAGVHPYGISRDSAWTHIAWMQALDLNFPLLSDWNAERSAFLVDPGGTVRRAWRYANDEVPGFDELLAAARAM
jgi:peroxiredoxin